MIVGFQLFAPFGYSALHVWVPRQIPAFCIRESSTITRIAARDAAYTWRSAECVMQLSLYPPPSPPPPPPRAREDDKDDEDDEDDEDDKDDEDDEDDKDEGAAKAGSGLSAVAIAMIAVWSTVGVACAAAAARYAYKRRRAAREPPPASLRNIRVTVR